jgi:hypothetical protein
LRETVVQLAERRLWNNFARSLRLDGGEFNHLGPFCEFGDDELLTFDR